MGTFLFLATLMLASSAPSAPSASAAGIPPMKDACAGIPCSASQRAIAADFDAGHGPQLPALPLLVSGSCYHYGPYDPEHAHHAYVFLDAKNERAYMSGLFSFFAPENPYADLTVEQARARAGDFYTDHNHVVLGADTAFIDYNPTDPTNPWLYWMRMNAAGDEMLLIAQWSIHQRVFCRLGVNP